MPNQKILILCGPSGAGKTTLAAELLRSIPCLQFSISATTRKPRPKEQHEVDYYFLTQEEFETRLEQDAFIEHQQVYAGLYYGTLKSEIDRIWQLGKTPMLDIDVVGALNIKALFGERARVAFIHPGSIEHLADRLNARATETAESLKMRLDKAQEEIEQAQKCDVVIYNLDLNVAIDQLKEWVSQQGIETEQR